MGLVKLPFLCPGQDEGFKSFPWSSDLGQNQNLRIILTPEIICLIHPNPMGWPKVTAPPQPICFKLIPVSVSVHDPIFALRFFTLGCGCALELCDSSICIFLCQLCPLCATTFLLCMMRTKSSGMHQTRSSRWRKNHPSGSTIAWGKRKHLKKWDLFVPELP